MESSSLKKILFIINPHSGNRRREDMADAIYRHIDPKRFVFEISYTKYAGHAAELSRRAVKEGFNAVVAVGGDGTINEVAGALIYSDLVLGIVPQGSGNGLARHLGIPRNPDKALSLINGFYSRDVDTGMVNDQHFISIAGVGFDALVAKLFAKGERRGFMGYVAVVANKYLQYKPKRYELKFPDGSIIESRALFIAFANSNQFGYNATIAPNALLTDGLLDVCVVRKPPLISLPIVANLLLLRKVHLMQEVNIYQTSAVEVNQTRNRVVNIDGEPVTIGKKLQVRVNPRSLRVIIPDNHANV